jgi:hypothetical protein
MHFRESRSVSSRDATNPLNRAGAKESQSLAKKIVMVKRYHPNLHEVLIQRVIAGTDRLPLFTTPW